MESPRQQQGLVIVKLAFDSERAVRRVGTLGLELLELVLGRAPEKGSNEGQGSGLSLDESQLARVSRVSLLRPVGSLMRRQSKWIELLARLLESGEDAEVYEGARQAF
jgi:hypothetical protein